MPRRHLVSVVIIFLNEERFLEEAIASVMGQTYEHWELLLVDDGSTDGSAHIAQQWAARSPGRVRYLTHPRGENRGMSLSRNLGIEQSRGELFALLDGDDAWLPDKLATQVALLDEHREAAMVYDAARIWYSWSSAPAAEPDRLRGLGVAPGTFIRPPALVTAVLSREVETPGTCSLLMRREAVEAVGGFVGSFRGMYEDQAFLMKMFLEFPVFVAGGSTSLYRQHAASACRRFEVAGLYRAGRHHLAHQQFLEWFAGYVADKRVDDVRVLRALDDALLPYHHPWRHRLRAFDEQLTAGVKRPVRWVAHRLLPARALRAISHRRAAVSRRHAA